MNFGYVERERSMHWPAVAWDLKKRISSNHIHRWEKARRRHWILAYVSPKEFLNGSNAGATGFFCAYFKIFLAVAFPPPQKT
jgi:hypothetical protein